MPDRNQENTGSAAEAALGFVSLGELLNVPAWHTPVRCKLSVRSVEDQVIFLTVIQQIGVCSLPSKFCFG